MKRVFVIGNGESRRSIDLRQLREQESIFNQAFSSTANILNSLNDLRQEHHQAQLEIQKESKPI